MYYVLINLSHDQTKCLLLNDEPCMITLSFIDMNLVELKYHPFTISLNKCIGSCDL